MRRLFGGGDGAIDWLVVGLGNPGPEYARSRHNVGFMIAQRLAERWDLRRVKDRFKAQLEEGRPPLTALPQGAPRPHVAVLRPQTFYNDAGRAVGPARGTFKLALDRVLVVHDEIDLPFGEIRSRVGGGLAGNNGLKSIKAALGGDGFARVRVGVGRPDSTDPEIVAAYVLGRFKERGEEVERLLDEGCRAVEAQLLGEGQTAGRERPGGEGQASGEGQA